MLCIKNKNCLDCNSSYVEQTKKIKDSFKRNNDIKKPSDVYLISQITILDYYRIDWEKKFFTKILDSEQYDKKMVSEIIHIKRQKMYLNKHSDIQRFPDIYLPIIEKSLIHQ